MGSDISLLCELMKCDEGPSLQGEQTILLVAENPSHSHCADSHAQLFLGENWGHRAAFWSPRLHHLISRSLEKQGSGAMERRLGVLSIPLLCLGPVYTLTTGTQSGPEFAPVRMCRASASQGVQQLLHLMATLAQLPS